MVYCLCTSSLLGTHPHPKASLEPLTVRPTAAGELEPMFYLHINKEPASFLSSLNPFPCSAATKHIFTS